MNNLNGFMELTQDDLMLITGGEGFWSGVWESIKDAGRGFLDGLRDFSLPM